MEDAQYFRKQADRCFHLVLECPDLGVARYLNAMGYQYLEKAQELEDHDLPSRRWQRSQPTVTARQTTA